MRLSKLPDDLKVLSGLDWVMLTLFFAWVASMALLPSLINKDEWDCCIEAWNRWQYLQAVWNKWQTINAGILAITASWIGLNIARNKEERQRVRELEAAKAFLPSGLSELCQYFKESAGCLNQLWENNGTKIALKPPRPPEIYRDIFRECIRHATPDVGEYMARILRNMQVHAARLRQSEQGVDRHTLVVYFFRLAELQVHVNQLFEFARGEVIGVPKSVDWENFSEAYSILNIEFDEIRIDEKFDLIGFTKRRIANRLV